MKDPLVKRSAWLNTWDISIGQRTDIEIRGSHATHLRGGSVADSGRNTSRFALREHFTHIDTSDNGSEREKSQLTVEEITVTV